MFTLLLFACLVVATDSSSPTDSWTSETVDSWDSAAPATDWQVLEGPCEAPEDLPVDPLNAAGAVETEGLTGIKMELIDAEWSVTRSIVFATGLGGLVGIDPDTGELLGQYLSADLRGYQDLALMTDERVALSSRSIGLHVVDASSPGAMRELSRTALEGVGSLNWGEGMLYVGTLTGELLAYALQPDGSLKEENRLSGFSSPWGIAVVGDRAYVADSGLGLATVDLVAFELVGWTASDGGPQDVVVDGEHLYLATGTTGLEIYSLVDPDSPEKLSRVETGQPVVALALDGDRIWTAQHAGPGVVDVSDAESPIVLASDSTFEWALGVAAHQGQAWVAAWSRMESFVLHPEFLAPDAAPSQEHLVVDGEGEFLLWNRGADTLEIEGASADGFQVSVDRVEVSPGQAATVRVVAGGEESGTLCLATNDPDQPLWEVSLSVGQDGLVGSLAPDIVLDDVDGTSWSLSDQNGHPVVLLYFATW
jgi:hypothetical protein